MKKIILLVSSIVLLNGCAQTTVLLAPAVTLGVGGGNIYQAGLSYGTSRTIENTTGKSATEHVSSYIQNQGKDKKRKKKFTEFLKAHIETTRVKLNFNGS